MKTARIRFLSNNHKQDGIKASSDSEDDADDVTDKRWKKRPNTARHSLGWAEILAGRASSTGGIIILPAGSAAANMTLLTIAAYIMQQQDSDTKKSQCGAGDSKPHRNSGAPAGPSADEEDNSRERERSL